ncbi:D-alanyl-D-alanine carboxypeptidase/D-alanyl-D-alanine-endopeptidase [Cognatishimia sp. WU-CL00825]|uniref:D-alanyl-D-alanine carboxypeptidase/D-alanyl-D-alanine endopeptidase n=1 Tax=Cognatishimia sp. WU-CL00825 TaxID=3127658 RepID=UPI0031038925
MMSKFSRRFFLSAVASAAASTALANPPTTSLRPHPRPAKLAVASVEKLIAKADLNGKIEFAVVDMESRKVLESQRVTSGLPPASVCKAVTALYALDVLGAAHRFVTKVYATGPIEQGVLKGDLILSGGGDPTLDTDALKMLAKSLKEIGLIRIEGRFLVYGAHLPFSEAIDKNQPAHVGYSPAISGICLNYNRVYFDWKKVGQGYDISMEARGETARPPVRVARMTLSDRKAPIFDYSARDGQDIWSVSRHALNEKGGRWLPVRQPEIYAGETLAWLAKQQGITLPLPQKTASKPTGAVLALHESAPLLSIIKGMLKYSTNVTAEMVGLAATLARGHYVASLRASGRKMSDWAAQNLGMKTAKFVDHSGLGDASRLHAEELAQALAAAQSQAAIGSILKTIALKDAQGKPDKNNPIKVVAKTGTLNFVSGLGGYIETESGQMLAFAIFAADQEARAKLTRAQRERPRGAKSWNRRAKGLQQAFIERWAQLSLVSY